MTSRRGLHISVSLQQREKVKITHTLRNNTLLVDITEFEKRKCDGSISLVGQLRQWQVLYASGPVLQQTKHLPIPAADILVDTDHKIKDKRTIFVAGTTWDVDVSVNTQEQ